MTNLASSPAPRFTEYSCITQATLYKKNENADRTEQTKYIATVQHSADNARAIFGSEI